MNVRHAVSALALVAALAVTGCTGAPPPTSATSGGPTAPADEPGDGGQSTADACAIIGQSIDDATAAFSSASPDDPAAVVSALQAASVELGTIAEQITNDEVAAMLPPLRDMFAGAAETMEALANGDVSRMAEITELSASFQEAAATYEDVCSGT